MVKKELVSHCVVKKELVSHCWFKKEPMSHHMATCAQITEAENSRLKEANAALLEGLKWYASFWNHEVQLEDFGITSMRIDQGQRARDLIAQYATPEPTEEATP